MQVLQPMEFDVGLVHAVRVNAWMIRAWAAEITAQRRSFKKESQAAADIRAVSLADVTTLAGDDTPGRARRLVGRGLQPIDAEIVEALQLGDRQIRAAAVCVYPKQVATAVEAARGLIPVASVATYFPTGQSYHDLKLLEIRRAIDDGATEIDVVISRDKVLTGQWRALYDEVLDFREACGDDAKLKVILGVGNLESLENVAKAAIIAILAGADTIKTSTGFEPENANYPAGLIMAQVIRFFRDEVDGRKVGIKPAGGIKTAADARKWLILMLETLGEEWTHPSLLRIGASDLLTNLNAQLYHRVTGRYSSLAHNHAVA
ncbi:deoxyribose-phosphate aldolase [Candidatus Berkelbacteria bacterium]|nr:deoxyribose-phosphate aldolase [Candidatus Berkelbacteria bacterium]